MIGKKNRKRHSIDRRSFVGQTAKLIALGSLLMPVMQACNNNKSSPLPPTQPKKEKNPSTHTAKKPRNKWSHEGLVINSKTKVMHFPSSKIYHYYDEIKPTHLQEISMTAWAAQLQEPVRLHKQQSGNILELLSLQQLRQGINDQSLTTAAGTLAKAFTPACENAKGFNLNSTNFRLHELLLQFIALNNSVPATNKWTTFISQVKKPEPLRKRQQWMATETNFNERIKYITDRQNEYITRLNQRAAKYSFS